MKSIIFKSFVSGDYDGCEYKFNEVLYEVSSLTVAILTAPFQKMVALKKSVIEFKYMIAP